MLATTVTCLAVLICHSDAHCARTSNTAKSKTRKTISLNLINILYLKERGLRHNMASPPGKKEKGDSLGSRLTRLLPIPFLTPPTTSTSRALDRSALFWGVCEHSSP